jgi:hypothetical protein
LVALALLLGAGAAQAESLIGECETTREDVAGDIEWFAAESMCGKETYAGPDPLFIFKGDPDCVIQRKLANKLDAEPVKPGRPTRGAATKVLQAKDEAALGYLQDYIDGIDKSRVADGMQDKVDDLRDTAGFLQGCVLGLDGLPPVE